jgi:hypothetical protein
LILQKHIKLGKKHLEDCLSQQEIDAIFQFVKLPSKTEEELSTSVSEVAGYVSLSVNTILTGALGFWMGLSAHLQKSLTSPSTLFVLFFALGVGGLIGYQSVRFRQRSARDALDKRKLKEVEIQIVSRVCSNRKKELEEKTEELTALLRSLKIEIDPEELRDPHLDVQALCLKWTSHLKGAVEKRGPSFQEEDPILKQIVEKLSHAETLPRITLKSQIRSHAGRLLVELVPTLFGGAASLFVYIGGIRTETEEVQSSVGLSFLERPEVKIAELVLVALITLYFAFSFCSINRKGFERERKLAQAEAKLITQENQLDLLSTQLLKIKECLRILERLR